VKCWEIIADNLKKRGWSSGWVSAVYSRGRTIWIADAHRDDGKRFVVRVDEMLTAFLEPEAANSRRRGQSADASGTCKLFVFFGGLNHSCQAKLTYD
jgi:hypothetical protein